MLQMGKKAKENKLIFFPSKNRLPDSPKKMFKLRFSEVSNWEKSSITNCNKICFKEMLDKFVEKLLELIQKLFKKFREKFDIVSS